MPEPAIDPDLLNEHLARFHRDGFLVVPGTFGRERASALLEQLREEYPEYLGHGEPDDHYQVGDRRFTAPLRYAPPFDCADFITHPLVEAMLSAMLGATYVLEAFGVVSSLPGAQEQHVHRDGGPLFPDSGLDGLLPASAVAVAMPLVDLNETTGMTVFWPGSHRQAKRDESVPGVAAEASAGSLVLWDFRTFHYGMPNKSAFARPFLYATVCRPFWNDHRNFVRGENAKLLASRASVDALDETRRARFIRADLTD